MTVRHGGKKPMQIIIKLALGKKLIFIDIISDYN